MNPGLSACEADTLPLSYTPNVMRLALKERREDERAELAKYEVITKPPTAKRRVDQAQAWRPVQGKVKVK